jgi:glycosyltransferase involved in cell wall biosynthesis
VKEILIIVPFDNIYPPMNGGKQRCINLLNQLSKYFSLTILTHQNEESFYQAVDDYPDLKKSVLLSTQSSKEPFDLFSFAPKKTRKALRYRYWNRSLRGPAENHYLLMYPVLKDLMKKKKIDIVILETLFIVETVSKLIRRYQPEAKIVYYAYNVDTKLARTEFNNGRIPRRNYLLTTRQESSLSNFVDAVFTCSSEDFQELSRMNRAPLNGFVVPNGVKLPDTSTSRNKTFGKTNNILFCGALDYFPNEEGLTWFCKEVLPLVIRENPKATLMVVGGGKPGPTLLELLKHESVIYYGMVDSVKEYYEKAELAIIPLLSGSGTRLKLLEAMGHQVAVVSTSAGAEGITYTNKKNIMIADDHLLFARTINRVLMDRSLSQMLASEGFQFVKEHYDWDIIGKRLRDYINSNELPWRKTG